MPAPSRAGTTMVTSSRVRDATTRTWMGEPPSSNRRTNCCAPSAAALLRLPRVGRRAGRRRRSVAAAGAARPRRGPNRRRYGACRDRARSASPAAAARAEPTRQLAVMPASTGSTAPVTAALSGLHTQASIAATSPGSTSRPSGWWVANSCGLDAVHRSRRVEHRGRRRPGRDRVRGDALRSELGREAADETDHAVLRRAVRGQQRQPERPPGRGHGDEAAVAWLRTGAAARERRRWPAATRPRG